MKTKKLTKKQRREIAKTMVFHIINAYDICAFDDCKELISDCEKYLILDEIKKIALKFESDLIVNVTTSGIVRAVKQGKDKNDTHK